MIFIFTEGKDSKEFKDIKKGDFPPEDFPGLSVWPTGSSSLGAGTGGVHPQLGSRGPGERAGKAIAAGLTKAHHRREPEDAADWKRKKKEKTHALKTICQL